MVCTRYSALPTPKPGQIFFPLNVPSREDEMTSSTCALTRIAAVPLLFSKFNQLYYYASSTTKCLFPSGKSIYLTSYTIPEVMAQSLVNGLLRVGRGMQKLESLSLFPNLSLWCTKMRSLNRTRFLPAHISYLLSPLSLSLLQL